MEHIQLSLFGKTSWELFHQITGWILRPCLNRSQIPKFQCLLPESGQTLEWSEGKIGRASCRERVPSGEVDHVDEDNESGRSCCRWTDARRPRRLDPTLRRS